MLLNLQRSSVRRIRVDGCLIKGSGASDWIVSKANCVDVVIELKGRDVDHAVEQIEATMRFWSNHASRGENTKLAALIVCAQYPRIDTKIQQAKHRLARGHGAPLHIRTRNGEYEFCSLAQYAES